MSGPTPKQIATIARLRRKGLSLTDCAKAVGVVRRTLFNWRQRGTKGECDACAVLVDELHRAESERNERLIDVILAHADAAQPTSWKAAAWILERRNIREWSKPETRIPLPEEAEEASTALEGFEGMTGQERVEAIRKAMGWG